MNSFFYYDRNPTLGRAIVKIGIAGVAAIISLIMIVYSAGILVLQKNINIQPYSAFVTKSVTERWGTTYTTDVTFAYEDSNGRHEGTFGFAGKDSRPERPEWGLPSRWDKYWYPGRSFTVYADANVPSDRRRYVLDYSKPADVRVDLLKEVSVFVIASIWMTRGLLKAKDI